MSQTPLGPDSNGKYKVQLKDNTVKDVYSFFIVPTLMVNYPYIPEKKTITMECKESLTTISDPNINSYAFFIGKVDVSAWILAPAVVTPNACAIASVRFCGVNSLKEKNCDMLPLGFVTDSVSPHQSKVAVTLDETMWNMTSTSEFMIETTALGGKVFTSEIKTLTVECPPTLNVTEDASRSVLDLYLEEKGEVEKINTY